MKQEKESYSVTEKDETKPIVFDVVTNIIYLSILSLLSGVVTLVQAFFQISLATSYKDELSDGCEFVDTSDSLPSKGILSFVIMLCMVL